MFRISNNNFKVIKKKTIIKLSKSTKNNIRKGLKRSKCLYQNNVITFKQYFSSIETYKYIDKIIIKDMIDNIIG